MIQRQLGPPMVAWETFKGTPLQRIQQAARTYLARYHRLPNEAQVHPHTYQRLLDLPHHYDSKGRPCVHVRLKDDNPKIPLVLVSRTATPSPWVVFILHRSAKKEKEDT